ncbi:uncharacterized protein LOC141849286 [Brevipalpus obovatus]|uniref:uncharacterized protein LOC141849286 n=1 Tax=Brevipalpus obovatus TaxID=246614 RepID=UPI003D9E314D
MKSNKVLSFFLCFMINIAVVYVEGDGSLKVGKINQICSDASRMILSGLSQEEVEKLIKTEISHEIEEISRGKQHYYEDDYGYSDNQVVSISTDHKVGEEGILNQVEIVGTDQSTGQYSTPVALTQVDNKFKDSENYDLNLNVNIAASLRSDDLKKNPARRSFNGLNRASDPGKRSMSHGECKKLVRQIFGQQVGEIQSRKVEKSSSLSDKNRNSINSLQRGPSYELVNTTIMDTRYAIGPGGSGVYVGMSSRGQSTNSGTRNLMDNQSHGNFKKADTSLLNFNLITEVSARREKNRKEMKRHF